MVQLLAVYFIAGSLFWECDNNSILDSYLKSDLVVACEVSGFHFEKEDLYLTLEIYRQMKDTVEQRIEVKYNHPEAYSDYKSGILWMNQLVGQKALIYIQGNSKIGFEIDVCSRFVTDDSEIINELTILNDFELNRYEAYWANNQTLNPELKSECLVAIDSLISINNSLDTLDGYPVVSTDLLINSDGELIGVLNPAINRAEITEDNRIKIVTTPASNRRESEVSVFFMNISNQLVNWKPIRVTNESGVNALIKIKWEIFDNQIVYRVM